MLSFIGYNLCFDENALDFVPTNLTNIRTTTISNAIYDRFNVTKDVKTPYTINVPEEWDFDTILNANFNNSINAGNLDIIINEIYKIKIKRRVVGTFNWVTIAEVLINSNVDNINFDIKDVFNVSNVEYEYAFVPVTPNGVEGDYIISNTILSKFNGVIVCDTDTVFNIIENAQYGSLTSNQKVGVYEPYGTKYPVVVYNSNLDYKTGSLSGTIVNEDYAETRKLDRNKIIERQNILDKFLKNKRAKVLKDFNGNIWLMCVVDSPTTNYNNSYGMGLADVSFNWVEQGNIENEADLYASGLVKAV